MTAHTPGPWLTDGHKVTGLNGAAHICDIVHHGYSYTDERAIANAALVTAAPELAAALRALLDWGRDHTGPHDPNSPHALLVAAANALTKAEGAA